MAHAPASSYKNPVVNWIDSGQYDDIAPLNITPLTTSIHPP